MKKLIILHSYPNNKKQLDVLSTCLDILKKTDYDIMLVSHYPIPHSVYKKANYYIFDEDNTLLPEEASPPLHYDFEDFQINLRAKNHALAITRSMRKSISFAKVLGYDFFWFMEADCHFSDNDLIRFDALRDQMFIEEKDMVFFKPKDFREHMFNSQVYETLIFGGKPLYFLTKWKQPITINEWMESKMNHMLEYDFYIKYKEDEIDFLIINEHSSDYFNSSDINIFRYGSFICEAVYYNNEQVVIFRYNSTYNKNVYKTVTKLDGIQVDESHFCKGCYTYSFHDVRGARFDIDIYENDVYSHTKTFILTEENLPSFRKKGVFKFN